MEWMTCKQCGFSQIPSGQCLRCQAPLAALVSPPAEGSTPQPPARSASSAAPVTARPPEPQRSRLPITIAAAAAALVVLALLFWGLRPRAATESPARPAEPASAVGALDLAGRWHEEVPISLGNPPRPALKGAFLETNREGEIVAAGVLLTDPGRGGAGGGYRIVQDGGSRLETVQTLISRSPRGATLPMDFVTYPPWVPQRNRVWRVLEGQGARPRQARYLLLESVEDDYLVQVGLNETGFLSYVFFSEPYASDRGIDVLSKVIHPEPGSSLRGFRDLVWDFTGSTNFLTLVVNARVSGPDGIPVRLALKR